MKIEYRTAGVGAYVILADESVEDGLGDRISGWQPQLSKSPQVDNLAWGLAPFIMDAGNGVWRFGFTVDREHASAEAALTYLAVHPLIFNVTRQNFDLKITQGADVTYAASCALTEFTPNPHSDKSTVCRYGFVGGSYSTEAA